MSRTDKTKPWWVRVAEHQPWAEHQHDAGICTLPATPYEVDIRWSGCHYSWWKLAFRDQCCHGCGCRMCSGYYWRREERRRSRHQAQRAARRAITNGEYDGWS